VSYESESREWVTLIGLSLSSEKQALAFAKFFKGLDAGKVEFLEFTPEENWFAFKFFKDQIPKALRER